MINLNVSVLSSIWLDVLFFTLVATAVSLISKLTSHQLVLPNQLLTVLGTVLVFISFLTSSAFERHKDAKKVWSNIVTASRNLAHMIWIYVPFEHPDEVSYQGSGTPRGVIEKKNMINLIQAFSFSLKHLLRDEPGIYYVDLYPLVCFLPRYTNLKEAHNDADTLSLTLPEIYEDRPRLPMLVVARPSLWDYITLVRFVKWSLQFTRRLFKRKSAKNHPRRKMVNQDTDKSIIPLEITSVLSSYIGYLVKMNFVAHPIGSSMVTCMNMLQDSWSEAERIQDTSMLYPYQLHLQTSVWLYLLFLPSQIYNAFGYLTIPATAFAAFLFLGFLEIGRQIEISFNHDLDPDCFCHIIARELHEITANTNPIPSTFAWTPASVKKISRKISSVDIGMTRPNQLSDNASLV